MFSPNSNANRNPLANQENNAMNNQISNTNSSATINQENNNMTQNTVDTRIANIFEARRQWVKNEWEKRIDLSKEQIATMSPKEAFLTMFEEGRIRVTTDSNATRKDGIAVIFSNNVQDDQTGRMLGLAENVDYLCRVNYREDGLRDFMLFDMGGSHDIQVVEEKSPINGHITYMVYYAQKAYNNNGEIIGLKRGTANKVQDGIYTKVTKYNDWVDRHNAAVLAIAKNEATEEQKTMIVDRPSVGKENDFVRDNTVRHIAYESIINHYALLAMVLADETRPAFEMYTFARTTESFERFLNSRESGLVWGYQRELEKLAAIEYVPATA
jgi:hypothetical protein